MAMVERFQPIQHGEMTKRLLALDTFREFADMLNQQRVEEWRSQGRELLLNSISYPGAALGIPACQDRVKAMQKHGVEEVARTILTRGNYHLGANTGNKIDQVEGSVSYRPNLKTKGTEPVVLLNMAGLAVGRLDAKAMRLNPKSIQNKVLEGSLSPREGVVLEIAHEMARLGVLSTSEGVLNKRMKHHVDKQIGKLGRLGTILLNYEIPEEVMLGGLPSVQTYVDKKVKTFGIIGLTTIPIIISACGGGSAPTVDGGATNMEPSLNPTEVSPTPAVINLPEVTLTAEPGSAFVGQPLPRIDLPQVPDYVPTGSSTRNVAEDLAKISGVYDVGLIPVLGSGTTAYVSASGKEYYPSFDKISGEGGIELIRGKMNQNGVVEYRSEDGKTVEYHLMAYDCPAEEICLQAYSTNESDLGVLYLVRLDKKSGKILGYVNTGKAGQAINSGNDLSWGDGQSENWSSVTSGATALQRMGDVYAYSYDNGLLTFMGEDGEKRTAVDGMIRHYAEFGGLVETTQGYYYYDQGENKFKLFEPVYESVGQYQLSSGMIVYSVDDGNRLAIGTETKYVWGNLLNQDNELKFVAENGTIYEWDGEEGWAEEAKALTIESLATMDDEAKIAAAPSVEVLQQEGQIAGDIDLSQVKVKVEAGHVVTYTYNGEHVAAHDLRLGMTLDQMSYAEYGKQMIQRVFFDNNWDFDGYTPSLEEREMLKEQVLKMVEGSFAVNWGFRQGEFSRPSENGELKAPGWDLRTVAKRNAFFEQVLLKNYRAAAANGTLFADGSVIPLDGGVQINGQLPDVIVVFEYNAENTTVILFNGHESTNTDEPGSYYWVEQVYDKESNVLKLIIGMNEKLARFTEKGLTGGEVLGSMGGMVLDQISSYGLGDMRGQVLLHGLGMNNLGPNIDGGRYGDLNPDSTVKPIFEGLLKQAYNQE